MKHSHMYAFEYSRLRNSTQTKLSMILTFSILPIRR